MTSSNTNPNRRPIAVRGWPVFGSLAAWLARRGVSPNSVSMAGMVAGILAGLVIGATSWHPDHKGLLLISGAALIQFRLLCNLIDGLVAVEGKRQTPAGELYNEVPDRVSDVATLVGAGYALASSPTLGWLAAVFAVFVAYVRAIGKGAGLASDFRGPMAKQQRMATITVACFYLALAPQGWQPVLPAFLDSPAPGIFALALAVIVIGCIYTSLRRLYGIGGQLRARSKPPEPSV